MKALSIRRIALMICLRLRQGWRNNQFGGWPCGHSSKREPRRVIRGNSQRVTKSYTDRAEPGNSRREQTMKTTIIKHKQGKAVKWAAGVRGVAIVIRLRRPELGERLKYVWQWADGKGGGEADNFQQIETNA